MRKRSGIIAVEYKTPGDSKWREMAPVNCHCRLAPHPRKPQVDPELVIEAIEYTYHARCRRQA